MQLLKLCCVVKFLLVLKFELSSQGPTGELVFLKGFLNISRLKIVVFLQRHEIVFISGRHVNHRHSSQHRISG